MTRSQSDLIGSTGRRIHWQPDSMGDSASILKARPSVERPSGACRDNLLRLKKIQRL